MWSPEKIRSEEEGEAGGDFLRSTPQKGGMKSIGVTVGTKRRKRFHQPYRYRVRGSENTTFQLSLGVKEENTKLEKKIWQRTEELGTVPLKTEEKGLSEGGKV